MNFKSISKIIKELRSRDHNLKLQNDQLKLQNAELEWAQIFHDTIRSKAWLKNLSISPGRWAGNYSFFYILVRILSDYKPGKIIEFGLGESTKVISSFVKNELHSSSHLIIEQDEMWIDWFKSRFPLPGQSDIISLTLLETGIKGFNVLSYNGIREKVQDTFDLYIVDGPFGSERYSRYDICILAERLTLGDEFIIIMDDYERQGEKDTSRDLLELFKAKGIEIFTSIYTGNKAQLVIATGKYKFTTSL